MHLGRPFRAVLSAICWILAVATAGLTAAGFLGGGAPCQVGKGQVCVPQTWLLIGGIVLTVAFGAAAAALYKPRSKPRTRFPWEYRD